MFKLLKKLKISVQLVIVFIALNFYTNNINAASVFSFPEVNSNQSCSVFTLKSTLTIVGVKVTNIFWDDKNSNGSFSFELIFTYSNLFNGTLPANGKFYTYQYSFITNNANVGGKKNTNNISNVAMINYTSNNISTTNNNTYKGSASKLGLENGVTYTDKSTIDLFGFNNATLEINAPCINNVVLATSALPDAPLPITLLSFEASLENSKTILTWSTSSEKNNKNFEVQASSNAKTWTTIGEVQSKANNGNSDLNLFYSFNYNNTLNGKMYYRLKINSIESNSEFSKVIYLNNITNNKISIYPNPASKNLNILGNNFTKATILNVSGKEVASFKLNNQVELNTIEISTINNGQYIMVIENEFNETISKLLNINN